MKKVAVILSGCGHKDGVEIREAVLTLLYLDKNNAKADCFAPNISLNVVNHITNQPDGTRNVLDEAARIARGNIQDLNLLKAADYDALILPGGYGAAKNLSDLAFTGANAKVIPELEMVLQEFNSAKKPIGAICIAPAVLVAGLKKGKVTIGNDVGTAAAINSMGGNHENHQTPEICVDEANKFVTTSAYMREDRISAVSEGIEKLVIKILELA